MDKLKLYEKVKECKTQNLEDSVIVMKLIDSDTTPQQVREKIKEYDELQELGKKMKKLCEKLGTIEDFDELGITMIGELLFS